MKLCALTMTYNRPDTLGRMIHCFQQQTHEDRVMFILDDGNQYDCIDGGNWQLISVPNRYQTLGDKRNASVAMALAIWPDIDAWVIADDDDVIWPHHMTAVDMALQKQPWCQPSLVYETHAVDDQRRPSCLKRCETGSRLYEQMPAYGGSWAWTVEAFAATGGYKSQDTDDDRYIARRLTELYGKAADTICKLFPEPSYWYCRHPRQISDLGNDFWSQRASEDIQRVGYPDVGWGGPNLYALPVIPGIHPRPWEDPRLVLEPDGHYGERQ